MHHFFFFFLTYRTAFFWNELEEEIEDTYIFHLLQKPVVYTTRVSNTSDCWVPSSVLYNCYL